MKDKKVLIILDGYFENTSEIKDIINLNFEKLQKKSKFFYRGEVDNSLLEYDVDSLNCIFNILGYSPKENKIYERAYFEALSRGYNLNLDKSLLRCNLVKVNNGRLIDFTGGLSTKDMDLLISKFIDNLKDKREFNKYFNLLHCDAYRNLLFVNEKYEKLNNIVFLKPHSNVGKYIKDILPKMQGENSESLNLLLKFIKFSYNYFKTLGYEGLMLYPWGLSKRSEIAPLTEKYNINGGVISGIDLVRGMGKSLGLKVIKLKESTGDYDTSLIEKFNKAKENLNDLDFLLIHINGCDEIAHRKDTIGKALFLEKIFKELINPLVEEVNKKYNYSLLITGDHITNSLTGNHERGKGEFLLLNSKEKNINSHSESKELINLIFI